jgi:hypothetical protein
MQKAEEKKRMLDIRFELMISSVPDSNLIGRDTTQLHRDDQASSVREASYH